MIPLLLLTCALCAPQGDDEPVARFRIGPRTVTVSRTEIALEVADTQRRIDRGKEALTLLVDRALVESEARARGLSPTQADIAAKVREIANSLDSQGMTLEQILKQKDMTRERFENDCVRLTIAHERLVMASLELDDASEVTPEMLEL